MSGTGGHAMVIGGVALEFPEGRQPYSVQKSLMSKLLLALTSGSNALLSAPTGCGKTLALLTAALAWQEHVKAEGIVLAKQQPAAAAGSEDTALPGGFAADPEPAGTTEKQGAKAAKKRPQIIYASRTHAQVAQVIAELKRTPYAPSTVVLASRQHYCIHQVVSASAGREQECTKRLASDPVACEHYPRAEDLANYVRGDILDVEELAAAGREHGGCPYFAARSMAQSADLVMCPYNYIIDPGVRAAMGVELAGAVVLLDEAHNIENACTEAGSFESGLPALEAATRVLDDACTHVDAVVFGPLREAFTALCRFLREAVDDLRRQQLPEDKAFRLWPIGLAGLLEELLAMGFSNLASFSAALDTARDSPVLQARGAGKRGRKRKGRRGRGDAGEEQEGLPRVPGAELLATCKAFVECLTLVLGGLGEGKKGGQVGENNARHYCAALQFDTGKKEWQFCLWCLWPGVVFRPISDVAHAVVLASGTLSPMESFEAELGARFPIRLDGQHVVSADHVRAATVPWALGGERFEWTFRRSSQAQYDALAAFLVSAVDALPPASGALVFCPSYSVLGQAMKRLRDSGALARMGDGLWVGEETREQTGEALVATMRAALSRGRKALLLVPARGKVSEGIDFRDHECRLAVMVGIPYPSARDLKVVMKKQYNGAYPALPTGEQWYTLQAFRALNQCLGRCVRHEHDYGAVVLLDARFMAEPNRANLSAWVRRSLDPRPMHAQQVLASLRDFYAAMRGAEEAAAEVRRELDARTAFRRYCERVGVPAAADLFWCGLEGMRAALCQATLAES